MFRLRSLVFSKVLNSNLLDILKDIFYPENQYLQTIGELKVVSEELIYIDCIFKIKIA